MQGGGLFSFLRFVWNARHVSYRARCCALLLLLLLRYPIHHGCVQVLQVENHLGVTRRGHALDMARLCPCGNTFKPDSFFCRRCGDRRQPAAAQRGHGAAEADELAAASAAAEAVKFPQYESYVDSAVASLRSALRAQVRLPGGI